MEFAALDSESQKLSISSFVSSIIARYPLKVQSIECINFEFNATFRVTTTAGDRFALRVNINSRRTLANLAGEVELVRHLQKHSNITLPGPVPMIDGAFFGSGFHDESGRSLNFVLYSWIDGVELGTQPSLEHVRSLGAILAKMHNATESCSFPEGAKLDDLRDPLWNQTNNLVGSASSLSVRDQMSISEVLTEIDQFIENLYANGAPQPIHADLHGWNVLVSDEGLAILDFDDCALGYPLQDFATTMYYLDTDEQDLALREGYESVRPLPTYSARDMQLLLLQRRIVLLNYLAETSTPSHREIFPEYLKETLERISRFRSR